VEKIHENVKLQSDLQATLEDIENKIQQAEEREKDNLVIKFTRVQRNPFTT